MGGSQRETRKVRPALEGLEDRELLSVRGPATGSKAVSDAALRQKILSAQNGLSADDRTLQYTTPEGTKVKITLYGVGALNGTTVDTNGTLNLVFEGTNVNTRIVGHTQGGTGRATVATVRDAAAAAVTTSPTGSEALNVLNLRHFDLLPGGAINLLGGVNYVYIGSIGAGAQLHLLANPQTSTVTTTTGGSAAPIGIGSGSSTNSVNTSTTSVTGATSSTNGVTTTVSNSSGSISGTSVAVTGTSTNTETVPTGVVLDVDGSVNGPALGSPPLGNPQVFGYDPTANALYRFDTGTGAITLTIPLPSGSGAPMAGVALGRDNGTQVALVGIGSTVFAFNAVTGASMGSFSTADLAPLGLTAIDGVGSTDTTTVLSDSTAGPDGTIIAVDVTRSLASGVAQPSSAPFSPAREFQLNGGLTGVAGSSTLYALGAAHFDTFQPDQTQLGVLGFAQVAKLGFVETSRTAVFNISTNPVIDLGPPGSVEALPTEILGSVDGDLAIDRGVGAGKNIVGLYSTPSTTTSSTTGATSTTPPVLQSLISLNDPNPLRGLSESFHPEIVDAALVDVQGNLKTFYAQSAQGLIINDNGTLNLVDIRSASDTEVIARPLNHVSIPVRNNVLLLSAAPRGQTGEATRNGVEVSTGSRQIGPLTLP